MYAIVKTGGKQYKVSAGDFLNVEKLNAEAGDTVALDVIAVVDGDKIEADPAKASKTKVEAVVVEQFRARSSSSLNLRNARTTSVLVVIVRI